MTFSITELTLAYPEQLVCEFTPEQQAEALPADQDYSHDAARYRAYLNQLCLNVLLPIFPEEKNYNQSSSQSSPQSSKVFPDRLLPTIWELLNGTPIYFGNTRLVMIPSEAIDTEELSVPQEWVDIPQWAADYYLAVQVNIEDSWLRVWGFTTHEKLKNKGTYDASDRTYCLDSDELFENLNTLWVARQLCSAEKGAIAPLPSLSATQIGNLLDKLGQPSAYSPRLKMPFAQWGALLSDDKLRQQLYQRRLGKVPVIEQLENQLENLVKLVENIFPPRWLRLDELSKNYQVNLALARSAARGDRNNAESPLAPLSKGGTNQEGFEPEKLGDRPLEVSRGRIIDLGIQLENYQVALIVRCTSAAENKRDILLQVYPGGGETVLPPGLELIVLDENGEIFDRVSSRQADNRIQLEIDGYPGERFTVKVALGDAEILEKFII
jgi:hypothetical protein